MTEIECINCQTKYNVDEDKIEYKKKRLRCAKCKQIFTYKKSKEDSSKVVVEKLELPKKDDIKSNKNDVNEIFERLDKNLKNYEETKDIESVTPAVFLGLDKKNNVIGFAIALIIILLLCINYYRYEITKYLPVMESVYKSVGIKSVISGDGLEFVNVTRNEYEDDGINYMNIDGYIANNTQKSLEIPNIIVSLLSADAYVLQTQTSKADENEVAANDRISFNIAIRKPSALGKYVYLTFEE